MRRMMMAVLMGGGAAPTYTISGTITSNGSGLMGVTVTLGAYSDVTAADGTYAITGISAGTAGDLTPAKVGYTFYPAKIAISSLGSNLTAQNFMDAIVILDGFSGANGTDLNGRTPDTKFNGNHWAAVSGATTIQLNKAKTGTAGMYIIDSGLSDCKITCDLSLITNDASGHGLMCRYIDANNYLKIIVVPGASVYSIGDVVGGVAITRAQATVAGLNSGTHTLVVTLDGIYIHATIDGGNPISYVSEIFQTATIHGMRCAVADQIYDNFRVEHLDASQVIDVFVVAGQSNASGMLTNNQTTCADAFKLGKNYTFATLSDPTHDNTGAVYAKDVDISGATIGSIWPLVGASLFASTGKTLLFLPCGKGGEGLSNHWQPGVDHRDVTTNYGCMILRAEYAATHGGTLRAVLFLGGEGEIDTGMNQATFNGYLDTFSNAVKVDLNIPTIMAKTYNFAGKDETAVNAAIAEAWGNNANCLTGPDCSVIDADNGWHITTNALAAAANLWAAAIKTAMGW